MSELKDCRWCKESYDETEVVVINGHFCCEECQTNPTCVSELRQAEPGDDELEDEPFDGAPRYQGDDDEDDHPYYLS